MITGVVPSDGIKVFKISDDFIFNVAELSQGWQQKYSFSITSLSMASFIFFSLSKIRLRMLNEPGEVLSIFSISSPEVKESLEEPRIFEILLVTKCLSFLKISR